MIANDKNISLFKKGFGGTLEAQNIIKVIKILVVLSPN